MSKQALFPYFEQALRSEQGVETIGVNGAAMLHFDNLNNDDIQELKYPCRIDALVMIICVRGEMSFSSHMSDYELHADQFFISPSSMFQLHSVHNCEFYMMAFNMNFLTSMNADIRFMAQLESQLRSRAKIVAIDKAKVEGVGRFFATMHKNYGGNTSEYKEASLRHIFCAIIYHICDIIIGAENSVSVVSVKDRSSEYFERLMALLSIHYREQRNVEFYAEKMHISSKHLSRVIRNFTGRSVHQWIDEFVALEIKNLLKYSDMSIQQISYSLNFPNPSFMGQYFKRITGLTPGEYKKS